MAITEAQATPPGSRRTSGGEPNKDAPGLIPTSSDAVASREYAVGAACIPLDRCRNGRHSKREWLPGRPPTMPRGFPARALFPKIRLARGVGTVSLRTPYLLFIGDAPDQLAARPRPASPSGGRKFRAA